MVSTNDDSFGPAGAGHAWEWLEQHGFDLQTLSAFEPTTAAQGEWPGFCGLMLALHAHQPAWPAQIGVVRRWYEPRLEGLHDEAHIRRGDLELVERE